MTKTIHRTHSGLAELQAPATTSAVPTLTSVHMTPGRGNYGDARYPGNCSGLLIRDLLKYYQPKRVLDPMTGSGTCLDVCDELGIEYTYGDLVQGDDATAPQAFRACPPVDFVWMHPPYWKLIRYSEDPRCLSNAPTLEDFFDRMRRVLRNCLEVLAPQGHIAILMGDAKADGEYLGLPFKTLHAAHQEGLWLAAPEIIRPSYGATSSSKTYSGRFIPRLHDVCLVLKRHRTLHGW